jgi:hypothetical protein
MSLATGHYQLASAFKTLQVRWDQTCLSWRDAVRLEFDRRHWRPLEERVPGLLSAVDRLDQVLNRVRQDCS